MGRLRHKRGRKSNYVKSLNNDYHKEVRRKVLIRDRFKCRFSGCDSKIYIELHHISYYINGASIIGKELNNLEWLCMLCESHHDKVHKDLNHKWNPKNKLKEAVK